MARSIAAVDFVYASVALEDELAEAGLAFTVPEADITSFSDAWQNFLAGKPTAVITGRGFLDPAASQGDVTIFGDLGGAAQTYDVEPDGTTGYNGYAIITSYNISARVNEAIGYDLTLRHNGQSAAADGLAPTRA